jgi:prophage regulatory protein
MKRLIRLPEVLFKTGMQKSQIFEAEQHGRFPKRVTPMPGGRAVAWLESEVDDFIDSRCAARDEPRTNYGRPPSKPAPEKIR